MNLFDSGSFEQKKNCDKKRYKIMINGEVQVDRKPFQSICFLKKPKTYKSNAPDDSKYAVNVERPSPSIQVLEKHSR